MSHTTREYRYDRVDNDCSSWFLPSPLPTFVIFVHLFKIGMRVVRKMLKVRAIAPSLREGLDSLDLVRFASAVLILSPWVLPRARSCLHLISARSADIGAMARWGPAAPDTQTQSRTNGGVAVTREDPSRGRNSHWLEDMYKAQQSSREKGRQEGRKSSTLHKQLLQFFNTYCPSKVDQADNLHRQWTAGKPYTRNHLTRHPTPETRNLTPNP